MTSAPPQLVFSFSHNTCHIAILSAANSCLLPTCTHTTSDALIRALPSASESVDALHNTTPPPSPSPEPSPPLPLPASLETASRVYRFYMISSLSSSSPSQQRFRRVFAHLDLASAGSNDMLDFRFHLLRAVRLQAHNPFQLLHTCLRARARAHTHTHTHTCWHAHTHTHVNVRP